MLGELALTSRVQPYGHRRACAQYGISFQTAHAIPCHRLVFALNRFLPPDIAVFSCREVPADFHARYSCAGKEYVGEIWNGGNLIPIPAGTRPALPLSARYRAFCRRRPPIILERMTSRPSAQWTGGNGATWSAPSPVRRSAGMAG